MRERVLEPELMDDPALNGRRHTTALRGLARLNRLSSAGAAVYGCLEDLIERATPGRPLRVLDVASGGGDVAIALAKQGKDRVAVHGCDISKRAVQRANAAARR
ncbi:MAG: methyltransferase domain-containing protein, partial [Phycisphaeraceae bacterium]